MKPLGIVVFLAFCGCFLLSEAEDTKIRHQIISQLDPRDVYGAKSNFKCEFPFGAFPDPDDCDNYYVCVAGISVHRKCKPFQQFDILRRKCVPFIIAVCFENKGKKTTTSVTTTTVTSTTGGSFSCPNFVGSFPHPEDCSKYYSCLFYKATLKTCPEKQLFDAVKAECKPEDDVHCGSRDRPGTTTTAITETEQQSTTTEVVTPSSTKSTMEDIVDTSTATSETTTNDITTKERPTGPPETDCDEDDLDCIIDNTGDVEDWFRCPEDIGAHVHPSSDKLFIFCMNWIPSVKKCGMDLVFSHELATCVEPEHLL